MTTFRRIEIEVEVEVEIEEVQEELLQITIKTIEEIEIMTVGNIIEEVDTTAVVVEEEEDGIIDKLCSRKKED